MSKDNNDHKNIDAFSPLMEPAQIKALIKERGWNQKQVAEYWGYTEKYISELVLNKKGKRGLRDDCAFMGLPDRNINL